MHCYSPEDLAALNGPVADIPDDLLHRVVHEVPGHLEPFDVLWRRVLPRVTSAGLDTPALSHLRQAEWQSWPEGERAAVEELLVRWFDGERSHAEVDALEGMSAATGSVTPWLERHCPDLSDDALVELVVMCAEPGPLPGWWPPEASDELATWLLQDWVAVTVDHSPEGSRAWDRLNA